MDKN
jgi:hypothetical protein